MSTLPFPDLYILLPLPGVQIQILAPALVGALSRFLASPAAKEYDDMTVQILKVSPADGLTLSVFGLNPD